MTQHDEELEVRDAIREAFPLEAGLSAEKARDLYASLRSTQLVEPRRARRMWAVAAVAAVLVVGLGTAAVFATRPAPVTPLPEVDEQPAPAPAQPTAPGGLVPALALKAITTTPAEVLHFTSSADTEFGPNAGHSTDEMWFDPKSGSGRLVRKEFDGGRVVGTKTIVSDGSTAVVTTQKTGGAAVTQPAGKRELRSLDKLSAYRNMLQSGVATVTARGTKDGVETYKLRAVVPAFGGSDFEMVMEAEIRATDYLPLSCSSAFKSADGKKTLPLTSRTFSKFERVKTADLPQGWFKPNASGQVRDGGAPQGALEI